MYLLDPQGGGRRRAVARDKAVSSLKKGGQALRKTSIDVGNRTRGLVARAGSHLRKDDADDQILEARVRSKLGRWLSHPSAVHVEVQDGLVILSGPVLASEMDRLLSKVQKVKGVQDVESRLEAHESAEGVSALQGEGGNGRFSLKSFPPRTAALGVGALAGTVGLGLLASKARGRNFGDFARPLRESRWIRSRSSSQLEW
jgi:hypothetical protein